MPIFRYLCKKCKKKFDVFQRITDKPLKNCSFCKGKVSRLPDESSESAKAIYNSFLESTYKKENNR